MLLHQTVTQWQGQVRADLWLGRRYLLQKLRAINETGWLERVIYVSAACPLNVPCSQVHLDGTGGRLWRRSSAQSWLCVPLWTNLGIKPFKKGVKYLEKQNAPDCFFNKLAKRGTIWSHKQCRMKCSNKCYYGASASFIEEWKHAQGITCVMCQTCASFP